MVYLYLIISCLYSFNMSVLLVFISLSLLAVCQADDPDAPQIRCGEMPRAVFKCLGTPQIVQPGIAAQCAGTHPECERLACIFRKSGLMDGDKVDRVKLTEYYDNFAKNNPDWRAAVDGVKTACLQADIPPQGIYLHCPVYDAMTCSFAAFLRYASPSLWKTSKECEYPRQYAAACPFCPEDCYGAIPAGSCNACRALPKNP